MPGMRLFSYRDRPVHLGPYPLERLARADARPEPATGEPMGTVSFEDADLLRSAKLGILAASVVAGLLGYSLLRRAGGSGAPADPSSGDSAEQPMPTVV